MSSLWRNLHLSRTITAAAADFFALQPRQTLALCSDRRGLCINPNRQCSGKRYNVPPSAEFVARVSGIPTMAKLPYQDTAEGLDAAFVGVPIDTGTSNRPGARWCFSLQLIFKRMGLLHRRLSYCMHNKAIVFRRLKIDLNFTLVIKVTKLILSSCCAMSKT